MSEKNIALKTKVIDSVKEKISKAASVIIVDYRGLTVAEDTELRNALRKANVEYKVLKNTLVLRAFEALGHKGFDEFLKGPSAVAFGYDDAIAPAKILSEFSTKLNKMKLKGGIIDSKVVSADEAKKYAKIPSKPVLVAQLLGMLTSPARSLAVALSEIAKKKA